MSRLPQHRYYTVKDSLGQAVPPFDSELMLSLRAVLQHKPATVPEAEYAYDIYRVASHRAALDAFTLSKTPLDITATALEIPEAVLSAYRTLFMDTSVFRNKLELMTYAAEYEGDEYGCELVRTGVSVGSEYLLWAYGAQSAEIDTRHVVRRTMLDSFFRGMAHKGNSLTSNVAKESQKWWSTAIRNAEILEKMDPRTQQSAFEELRIALEGRDDTLRTEQSPVPVEDILH